MNETINFNGKNPAGLLWASVMTKIHSNLPNAKFEMSDNIVTSVICKDSGKVANSSCKDTFKEYFLKGTIPDICNQHSGSNLNTKKPTPNSNSKPNTTTQNNDVSPTSTTVQNTQVVEQNNNTSKPTTSPSQNIVNNISTQNTTQNSTQNNTTNTNVTNNTSINNTNSQTNISTEL